MSKSTPTRALMFVGLFLFVSTSRATEDPKLLSVDCDEGKTIAKALQKVKSGGTIVVTGTCNENIAVTAKHRMITLDGQGTASINGPDLGEPVIDVKGNDIAIKGLTISGGRFGVHIHDGGTAILDGNVVRNAVEDGLQIRLGASAVVVNNTVQNNGQEGISIGEGASARIGFREGRGMRTAEPNVIQNNGGRGIRITRTSSARIYSNTISNNGGRGVEVARTSFADISSNAIDGNGNDGILVNQNSAVVLGADTTEDPIADDPNRTTVNNNGFGIRCAINSSVDGRRGTLTGASGPAAFDVTCVNSTIP